MTNYWRRGRHHPPSPSLTGPWTFFLKHMTFSRKYLCANLCFMSSGAALLECQHWRDHLFPFCSFSSWKVLHLSAHIYYQQPHLTQSLFIAYMSKTADMRCGRSERCNFQEWLLWLMNVMDLWAEWHSPVKCFGRKTYREHIMQKISHPWPLPYTSMCCIVKYGLEIMVMHLLPFRCWTWLSVLAFYFHPASWN